MLFRSIALANIYPQVFLEPSWCTFYNVSAMIDAVGAHRVMFGSDLPANVIVMKETVRALELNQNDESMVMGKSAINFFKLDL